ncbi:MAG: HAD-IC family P-type ATPase [Clostridia bacterium]|nr:HAD-IC family P-type ATPase [Clostridia bacterium]
MDDSLKIPSALPENFRYTRPAGLTAREAEDRRGEGLDNRVKADPGKSVWQIVLSNLITPFNLLNIALAVCLALVGSFRNMLFMGVVFSNTLIGTVQELRARHTIRKLQVLNAPEAHVLRDGQEMICRPEELVQDDLVILRAGDQVLADAIAVSGGGAADESLLTGESEAVRKQDGDWLLSGSFITEGRLTAQLVHVGDSSYAARMTRSARAIKRPKSALMTDLNRLIRLISMLLVPLGILLFLKQRYLQHAPLTDAVPSTVAAMIGMIPEGLLLLVSIALAVGVVKLGRRNTLVQELYGIETLARADVLCLDKTGTITTGEMAADGLIPFEMEEEAFRAQLARFLGAFDEQTGTLDALRECVQPSDETAVAVLPFSSARKKSAASFADGKTLILGAPAFVLGEQYDPVLRACAEDYAARGSRVLVLAQAEGCVTQTDAPPVERVLGLCLLRDCIREHAEETLMYFRQQGVRVKVISGDDPRTVSAIARRVKLDGWDSWADASAMTDQELAEACERCTVFGRVTPEQKKTLVETLKGSGHSVAMTGDGVNDIPALKAADCSIAMAGGSDAAKRVAQLTLMDADFASMPQVVLEGRRVVNNVTRAASLFLVKTLYSFALTVLLLLLPAEYPFQPIQLTLISSLTIGIPSFFLALESNRERIRGRFLDEVMLRAIPGAAGVTLCAVLSMLMAQLGWSQELCSTLATLSAGSIGLMVLLFCCWPLNPMRIALWLGMTALFTLAAMYAGPVFFLVSLNVPQLITLGFFVAAGMGALGGARYLIQRRRRAEPARKAA